MRVRVLAPSPPSPDAAPAAPDLEDAYLTIIHAAGAGRSPHGVLRDDPARAQR
ncbi:MAG: hypothetical protein ACRDPO_24255 [Streptosporangiaceae bacterium]